MKNIILKNTSNCVDRDFETNEIIQDIVNTDKSTIRLIYSKTAIGKSSLTKKISCDKRIKNWNKIIVRTYPKNNIECSSEWTFLSNMFFSVSKQFQNSNKFSFDYYVNNLLDKYLKKLVLDEIIDKIYENNSKHKFFSVFSFYVSKRLFKLGTFDSKRIAEENSTLSFNIKKNYIKYILNKQKILCIIDNVQNFDDSSLKIFIDLINETKNLNNYFILEYTVTDENNEHEMFSFGNYISNTGVKIKLSKLNVLPSEYTVDVINNHIENKPNNINFNVDLISYFNKEADGNIRKLIDFAVNYENDDAKKLECDDETLKNLNCLSNNSKYVLALIIYCNGIFEKELFNIISQKKPDLKDDIDNILSELKSKYLIENDNDNIRICHSSIIDVWTSHKSEFSIFNKLVYNDLNQEILNIILNNNISNEMSTRKYCIILLNMYVSNDLQKIIDLLEIMKKDVFNNLSPKSIWMYLNLFIDNVEMSLDLVPVYKNIIDLCFKLELYKEGNYCLDKLIKYTGINNNLLFQKQLFLSELDEHEKNIEIYEKYKDFFEKGTKEYLLLNLCVLSSYRTLSQTNKCLEIFRELISNKSYKDYIEYGYLLRLSDMILPNNKSINYVYKSIKFFKRKQDTIQAAKSMITYSRLIALKGNYKIALKVINRASKILRDNKIGNHMFLVNKSSILLLKGDYSESVWTLLDDAENSATVSFDRLAIVSNKIVWCIENNNFSRAVLLENLALELIKQEPDKHIHGIVYYNLYYLKEKAGDKEKAKIYLNKATELEEYCRFVKCRLHKIKTKETKIMLKRPWHVCFLADWTFDLYDM